MIWTSPDLRLYATWIEFAVGQAHKSGRFKDEIVPVTVPSYTGEIVVDQDEYIRPGTTLDAVSQLKPAFSKGGTVTAGLTSAIRQGGHSCALQ